MYDMRGTMVYEMHSCPKMKGKSHVLQDSSGAIVLTFTLHGMMHRNDFNIVTSHGPVTAVFTRHAYRQSKRTIEIDGITYGMMKERIPGKYFQTIIKWRNLATAEPVMIEAGDYLVFYPACPEALEKALVMVVSYQCHMRDLAE